MYSPVTLTCAQEFVWVTLHSYQFESLKETRIQGYLFACDIDKCTRICLDDVAFTQSTNKQNVTISHV